MDRFIFESYAGLEGQQLLGPILRDFAGKAAVISSFGAESAVLLHMVSQVDKATPVIFLDTGKHFWETLSYRAKLIDQLGLTAVRIITPATADLSTRDPDGTLHKNSADACCRIRKAIPLAKALEGFEVTISGRKRYHGAARATLDFLSIADGRLKVEPLAGFSALDIAAYMKTHDLPHHPLTEIGYFSIGCEPCTQAGGTAADCGIHWTHSGKDIVPPAGSVRH